jgi:hypothetical protein
MMHRLLFTVFAGLVASLAHGVDYGIDRPPHDYWTRPLGDGFSRVKGDLESGKTELDRSSELAFVRSLLRVLDVPESSQMLVFSATSLQQAQISPGNPRALYFNEELYIGWVPGGKIEIVSVDPQAGAIFHMFRIPRGGEMIRPDRSTKCINCHMNEDTRWVPGLVSKSVVPGPNGGSLMAFRKEQNGHGVPLKERFGGWYLTGKHKITEHWGNVAGRFNAGELTKVPLDAGTRFDAGRYPVATSDVLPQLLHEHQVGFDNRFIEAVYKTRALAVAKSASAGAELDKMARELTRYVLFADEVPLPNGGIEGDPAFVQAFARNRRAVPPGASLKDFELKTRMFKFRCSYMIYSPLFAGLPVELKMRIYKRMREALDVKVPDREYAYLPAAEKQAIRAILKATLKDLPQGW